VTEGYVTPAEPLSVIVAALLRAGVRDVVICPGSRSTPLALALRSASELRGWVHLDERAGAFFALGLAKASRRPAAILATSGTAVVNFAPAVAEARYGRVPLILLTADRPPELQGVGSSQTIDQVELYGRHAKWYAELPVPQASADQDAEIRNVVDRVVAVAMASPAGPVQLNLPFREPLLPVGVLTAPAPSREEPDPPLGAEPDRADLDRAAAAFSAARRPLIVCGPLDTPGFASAAARLAVATGSPLLADSLASVRTGSHDRSNVVAHYDALLRSETFRDRHVPDLVLRFGGPPTSKSLNQLLDEIDVPQLLVDDGGGWNAPRGPSLVKAGAVAFAGRLAVTVERHASSTDGEWLPAWRSADGAAAGALEVWFAALKEPFEGDIARALDEALPAGSLVIAGNSMPVRDLDVFMPASAHARRMLGNRGANGIDGLLSTTLGAAAAGEGPVVAVVGDLTFLHDLNALVAARRLGIDATVVLVNNDGGGIFSFLPQAQAERPEAGLPEYFEELFGTPHGTEFGPLVGALGAEHVLVGQGGLIAAIRTSMGRPGVGVVELRTDRHRNVELHHDAFAAVARALAGVA
jgi:2-succinyl-5-enolpyruvyl-6-hydroxy-3-cyclohexene-1-carboxylate synthase